MALALADRCLRRNRLLFAASVLTGVVVCAGCGGGVEVPKTVPVTGSVLYKGEPVEGASVSFWAEKAPRAATGVTNAKGEFSLSMFEINDGAIAGENKITVVKAPPSTATSSTADPKAVMNDPAALANMTKSEAVPATKNKPLLPPKYATLTATPLKETVSESGPNKFVLQLAD